MSASSRASSRVAGISLKRSLEIAFGGGSVTVLLGGEQVGLEMDAVGPSNLEAERSELDGDV